MGGGTRRTQLSALRVFAYKNLFRFEPETDIILEELKRKYKFMDERVEVASYIPDRGFLDQCHGVVLHYTPYDALPWIISNNEGIISLSNAYRTGRPIKSEHMVSVQDKNDRPEWISVLDVDDPQVPWNEALPCGHVTLIITKGGLPIKCGESQHRLAGEVWVEDWIRPENVQGFLVSDRILGMKIGDFLENEIGDFRYEHAYTRYAQQVRVGDKELNSRILAIANKVMDEVDRDMPGAYWLLEGQEAERRKKKAVVLEEWKRKYHLDFQAQTVGEWFKIIAREQRKKIWKVTSRQKQNGLEGLYIERIDQ